MITEEQIKAAYALNMCTVSISQIIDYNDIHVMEQEYEAILNNLNIEQMPKDEALLEILKQILDTITYFRIENRKKEFLEKEYRKKLKNAIWAAVPSPAILLNAHDAASCAISLAAAVGTGYMNYRREKAMIQSEKEEKDLELEITAMEQFNGLRRALFDTAWRLSSVYHFPDELRLTERQIHQFDMILMDRELIRRYNRLYSIKENFIAYPPFWYQMASTARQISDSLTYLEENTRKFYRDRAMEHYRQFWESNRYPLLREDLMACSCALEMIELMDPVTDREEILEKLGLALKMSGHRNDIVQIAAMDYLKMKEYSSAAVLLKQLVNEQYNTEMNAQFLSSVYANAFALTHDLQIRAEYDVLKRLVSAEYLYSLPETEQDLQRVNTEFIENQKMILQEKYELTVENFMAQNDIRFGKLLPSCGSQQNSEDRYFISTNEALIRRNNDLKNVLSSKARKKNYLDSLTGKTVREPLIELMNKMVEDACDMVFIDYPDQEKLILALKSGIIKNKQILTEYDKEIDENQEKGTPLDPDTLKKIVGLSFYDFTMEFYITLIQCCNKAVSSQKEMQDFLLAEDRLADFCERAGLEDPDQAYRRKDLLPQPSLTVKKNYLDMMLFDDGEAIMEEYRMIEELAVLIRKQGSVLIHDQKLHRMIYPGQPEMSRYLNKFNISGSLYQVNRILAVLESIAESKDGSLIFTPEGIIRNKDGKLSKVVRYSQVCWKNEKKHILNIGGDFSDINIRKTLLLELAGELNRKFNDGQMEPKKIRFPWDKN